MGVTEPIFSFVLTGENQTHILSVTYFCCYEGKYLCYYLGNSIEVFLRINTE